MRKRVVLNWLLSAAVLCAGPVAAQQSKPQPTKTAGDKVREVLPEAERVFTKEERTRITNYFKQNRSGLPPGLAKREKLPPGLEKQLRERGKLPPGLQKKIQPMPPQLEKELRILPTGWRRVVIAGNVVLMNEKTAVVYDIIRNAIP
jgi:hypothetical protein